MKKKMKHQLKIQIRQDEFTLQEGDRVRVIAPVYVSQTMYNFVLIQSAAGTNLNMDAFDSASGDLHDQPKPNGMVCAVGDDTYATVVEFCVMEHIHTGCSAVCPEILPDGSRIPIIVHPSYVRPLKGEIITRVLEEVKAGG